MLEIARLARGKQLNGRLLFTFTTGEEFGTALEAKGSFILAKHLKADRALVLEPQFDSDAKRVNIIHGCRGIENLKVRVRGKASHTGYPERGINAIDRTAAVLTRLQALDFHKISVSGQQIQTQRQQASAEGKAQSAKSKEVGRYVLGAMRRWRSATMDRPGGSDVRAIGRFGKGERGFNRLVFRMRTGRRATTLPG